MKPIYTCLNNDKGYKQFHALSYHVPVFFNFSEYGFHFPYTIFPSRNGLIIIRNLNIMIFHNIVTKVKLFRNLLIFRGDEHSFFFLKKKTELVFQGNERYIYIFIYKPVSYTHLTLPTTGIRCRSRWSPYH